MYKFLDMKTIIINESQAKELFGIFEEIYQEPHPQQPNMKKANKPYSINPEKVKIVKNYLDSGFKKGTYQIIGPDGFPQNKRIVAMIGNDGSVLKNMYEEQMVDLLVDKFQNMFSDHDERELFFKRVLDDWFNNKIGVLGTLSVNHL